MINIDKHGGSAFPQFGFAQSGLGHQLPYSYGGMTLRDYFAAQALPRSRGNVDSYTAAMLARSAYQVADAMLAERAKAGQP